MCVICSFIPPVIRKSERKVKKYGKQALEEGKNKKIDFAAQNRYIFVIHQFVNLASFLPLKQQGGRSMPAGDDF
jgi:hypothetical protein